METRNLIDQLSDELEPTAPMRARDGLLLVAATGLVTALGVAMILGLWTGALDGRASPFYFVVNGLLLVLGITAAVSAVSLAEPRVGNRHDAPRWGLAMVAILPVSAIIFALSQGYGVRDMMEGPGPWCFTKATASSVLFFAAMTMWLRRGAPISVELAGFYTGVAAGALGSFVYGISCPYDGLMVMGLWRVLPVLVLGVVGRFLLPQLIRW